MIMSYGRERAGNIVSDLFFIVVDILFGGFVTMVMWGWFISPTFNNIHELNLIQSIGLNIFISLFTTRPNSGTDQFERRVVYYLTLLVALGLGWIVHLFM